MRFTTIAAPLIPLAAPDTGRAGAPTPVAEVVTFRLVAGADPAEFAAAAHGMTPFLTATGAVLSRNLSQGQNGLWTDHIIWTGMQAAKDAAARIMQEPAAAPFMALIDPDTVTLRHEHIRFTLTPE